MLTGDGLFVPAAAPVVAGMSAAGDAVLSVEDVLPAVLGERGSRLSVAEPRTSPVEVVDPDEPVVDPTETSAPVAAVRFWFTEPANRSAGSEPEYGLSACGDGSEEVLTMRLATTTRESAPTTAARGISRIHARRRAADRGSTVMRSLGPSLL